MLRRVVQLLDFRCRRAGARNAPGCRATARRCRPTLPGAISAPAPTKPFFLITRAVEHRRAHADQAGVADHAGVDDRAVADGDVVADHRGQAAGRAVGAVVGDVDRRVPSCMLLRAPMRMKLTSPRMTVPGQTEASSPSSTSPITVAASGRPRRAGRGAGAMPRKRAHVSCRQIVAARMRPRRRRARLRGMDTALTPVDRPRARIRSPARRPSRAHSRATASGSRCSSGWKRPCAAIGDALVAACSADFGRRAPLETLGADVVVTPRRDQACAQAPAPLDAAAAARGQPRASGPARGELRYAAARRGRHRSRPGTIRSSWRSCRWSNALAAGNRVMIKPSEHTPAVSALLARLLERSLHRRRGRWWCRAMPR